MQVWQIDLSIEIHVRRHLDAHFGRRFDVADRGILRMRVHQPDADGYVVRVALILYRYGAVQIEQHLRAAIVEH